jgi:hypothetical protein
MPTRGQSVSEHSYLAETPNEAVDLDKNRPATRHARVRADEYGPFPCAHRSSETKWMGEPTRKLISAVCARSLRAFIGRIPP